MATRLTAKVIPMVVAATRRNPRSKPRPRPRPRRRSHRCRPPRNRGRGLVSSDRQQCFRLRMSYRNDSTESTSFQHDVSPVWVFHVASGTTAMIDSSSYYSDWCDDSYYYRHYYYYHHFCCKYIRATIQKHRIRHPRNDFTPAALSVLCSTLHISTRSLFHVV